MLNGGETRGSFAALAGIFPDLVVAASAENAAGKRWDELMNGAAPEIYIVDPFGNVVLRFADTTDMRGVLKDLERLLKYSWIQ